MVQVLTGGESLRRLFAALTENTFQAELGVADPNLTDYLSGLLVRFVRLDAIFRIRDTVGRRLEEVAEMMMEAEQREGKPKREIYRHIGDFALFWSGVYPEALARLNGETSVSCTRGIGCIRHMRTTCMFVCPAPISTRSAPGSEASMETNAECLMTNV